MRGPAPWQDPGWAQGVLEHRGPERLSPEGTQKGDSAGNTAMCPDGVCLASRPRGCSVASLHLALTCWGLETRSCCELIPLWGEAPATHPSHPTPRHHTDTPGPLHTGRFPVTEELPFWWNMDLDSGPGKTAVCPVFRMGGQRSVLTTRLWRPRDPQGPEISRLSLSCCCLAPNPSNTWCLDCAGDGEQPPQIWPSSGPSPQPVPSVLSKTVVCLTKATSPAFSARHLPHRRPEQVSAGGCQPLCPAPGPCQPPST